MNTDQFLESRQADWQALTELLDRSRGGINRLTPEQISAMGSLYRATTSDLALAQRDFPEQRVPLYLNQLVGRAHAVIYRGEPLAFKRMLRFATHGFPRVYRQSLPFIATAAALFIIPALIAALITGLRPESAQWLLPAGTQQLVSLIEDQELWVDIPVSERPYASTFIMTNNIQVAFLAFGGGMLAGLVTVWVMLFNGLLLGGITGLTIHYGVGFELWTFVIGHGVIELSVIIIAGGSGLMLGWSIIRPGLHRRRDALVSAAGRAVRLLIGCVPLLVIAGLIEGFISPSEILPWPIKWMVGLISGILLYGYLLMAGEEDEAEFVLPDVPLQQVTPL